MNEVFAAAVEVQDYLLNKGWKFSIIGGVALARWGQPRTTADVDFTLLTGFGSEESFIDELLNRFASRIPDAKEFSLRNRVLLLKASNGVGIDVALGALPFEENLTERASKFDYGRKVSLMTASAEDMIILKSFASRPQDWIDVEGIIVRQQQNLDWELILTELQPLCELKESPETIDRLLQLRDSLTAE
jgi:hypothetical protein